MERPGISAADHAATIRAAFDEVGASVDLPPGLDAALAALVTQADETERLRTMFADCHADFLEQRDLKEAAEARADQWERRAKDEEDQKRTASKAYLDMQARADQLQRERDEWKQAQWAAAEDAVTAQERADRAETALREAEWGGYRFVGLEPCPVCGNERTEGHTADCAVGAALADSGENELRYDDLTVEPWGRGTPKMGGGQSNPRGVRITHTPTGLTAEWDEEKSQLRNREAALSLLREKLADSGETA